MPILRRVAERQPHPCHCSRPCCIETLSQSHSQLCGKGQDRETDNFRGHGLRVLYLTLNGQVRDRRRSDCVPSWCVPDAVFSKSFSDLLNGTVTTEMQLLPVSVLLCVHFVSPHLRQQDQCIEIRLKLQLKLILKLVILGHVLLFD